MSRLMLFGAVSCLVLGSPAAGRADDAQDRAVKAVEKLGGKVTRDEDLPGKPVVVVNLRDTAVTDAGLRDLTPLTNLTALYLFNTKVTDAGLKELAALKSLTTLDLNNTKVTDAGLKELATLTNLTTLTLVGTALTDAGLRALREVGLLHTLDRASAAGGGRPAKPEDVTTLKLFNTAVTAAGLKELAAFKNPSLFTHHG